MSYTQEERALITRALEAHQRSLQRLIKSAGNLDVRKIYEKELQEVIELINYIKTGQKEIDYASAKKTNRK